VFTERTSVGLDVHARSVAAAAIDGVTGELFQARLTPSHEQIRSWVGQLPGPVAVTYEAGPTGFGLSRALNAAGIRCVVAAPSKLQRPSGDRVKTDARDAIHLARLLRLDEVTVVAVPALEQESARDLVRAREDCRADLMRARHRLEAAAAPGHRVLRWSGLDRCPRRVASSPTFHRCAASDDLRDRLRRRAHGQGAP
jgi:transposase